MPVTKEWKCLAHGSFTGPNPVCVHGCTTVIREFLTAPGGRSARTKAADGALEHLAQRFGLSDMSNRSGSVGGSRRQRPDFSPVWGQMPKGNVYEVGKGERPADPKGALVTGGGATGALGAMNMTGDIDRAMIEKYGPNVKKALAKIGMPENEPSMMDVQRALPKPRPRPVGREPGKPEDFAAAIERVPAE